MLIVLGIEKMDSQLPAVGAATGFDNHGLALIRQAQRTYQQSAHFPHIRARLQQDRCDFGRKHQRPLIGGQGELVQVL